MDLLQRNSAILYKFIGVTCTGAQHTTSAFAFYYWQA